MCSIHTFSWQSSYTQTMNPFPFNSKKILSKHGNKKNPKTNLFSHNISFRLPTCFPTTKEMGTYELTSTYKKP